MYFKTILSYKMCHLLMQSQGLSIEIPQRVLNNSSTCTNMHNGILERVCILNNQLLTYGHEKVSQIFRLQQFRVIYPFSIYIRLKFAYVIR